MNIEIISEIVTRLIDQSLAGSQVENPKVDFKRKWYDLQAKSGRSEFLKDTTAIANTVGLDGYIIIGFDDESKEFYDIKFSDSKLSDAAQLNDIINKNVTEPFDFSYLEILVHDNRLGVIYIPPSLHKPHFIRNYQTFDKDGNIKKEEAQRVFVRKNTSTHPASKYDIDLMYYDRKNIVPEYEIYSTFSLDKLHFNIGYGQTIGDVRMVDHIKLHLGITFENAGRRTVSIDTFSLKIALFENPNQGEEMTFQLYDRNPYLRGASLKSQEMIYRNFELNSIDFANKVSTYVQPILQNFQTNRKSLFVQQLVIRTTDNKEIYPRVNMNQ